MKLRWWMALIFAAVTAVAAEPEIELMGVTGNGRDYQLILKTKTGDPQWIAVGKQFAGYTVASYEPREETAVLTKDGQQFRLKLRQSKVASGGAPATELPPQVQRSILNNLRQLSAAADQYFLENGKSTATYDDLVGTTKYIKVMNIQAGENYRAVELVQGKTMRVTTSSGHSVSYAP